MFVYRFEHDGTQHSVELKPFDQIPMEALVNDQLAMLEWAMTPEGIALMDVLPTRVVKGLIKEWQKEIGLSEVLGLVDLISNHKDALAADLINAGMRLRDFPSERHTWYDLKVFVRHLDRDSALFREMYPDKADWTMTNRLLAMVVNCLRLMMWFKTKDGQKGRKRPPMIGPDWAEKNTKRPGSDCKPTPISQIKKPEIAKPEGRMRKLRNLFK